jgi:hypothetical protein
MNHLFEYRSSASSVGIAICYGLGYQGVGVPGPTAKNVILSIRFRLTLRSNKITIHEAKGGGAFA